MNENIIKAIEAICNDITNSYNADENKTRAEAIVFLAASSLVTPTVKTDEVLAEEKTSDRGENIAQVKPIKLPSFGRHFTYNGIDHVILGVEQGGVLAIRAEALDEKKQFDKNNSNDWRVASLRVDLNENEIKHYNKYDLLPFVSDLTADNGDKSYGTCEDYLFILSRELIRKYRAPLLMEIEANEILSLTPWLCDSGANTVCYLNSCGFFNCNNAHKSFDVLPACLFNPSIFE